MAKLGDTLKLASKTLVDNSIDYTSPVHDVDWQKSKQKLKPLYTDFHSHTLEYEPDQSSRIPKPRGSIESKKSVTSYAKRQRILTMQHVIDVPLSILTTLSIKPGEPQFLVWYFISMYFPLITACMGPIANMISVIGLIEPWRVDKFTNKTVDDYGYILAFNIISLVLGLMGNISLLMNFSGRIRYLVTQCVSILCWISASVFLTIAVVRMKIIHFNENSRYTPSEGYFFAIFTAAMYFLCCMILSVNFMGYKLNKYPPTFNLGPKQRTLMIFTICMAIWLLCGGILFAHMIPQISYGSSLYFCTVSVLTIGLGDIVPISPGSKVLSLMFSLIGVLIMGLIVTMIRQVVLSSGGPTIFWHQVEKERVKKLAALKKSNKNLSGQESYIEMRYIRTRAKSKQSHLSLLLTILNFMAFWLVGATVFYFTESWAYFNGFYFCFLCLLTIGYGDYHPVSPIGKVFFVCWGIAAVPLMTILISNVGDHLYNFAIGLSYYMAKLFFPDYYKYLMDIGNRKKDKSIADTDDMDSRESIVQHMNTIDLDNIEETLKRQRQMGLKFEREPQAQQACDESIMNGNQESKVMQMEDEMESRDLGIHPNQTSDEQDYTSSSKSSTQNISNTNGNPDNQSMAIDNSNKIKQFVGQEMNRSHFSSNINNLQVDDTNFLRLQTLRIEKNARQIGKMLELIQTVLHDAVTEEGKRYSHDEWVGFLDKICHDGHIETTDFWLSEESPLRLPLNEPKFLLSKFFDQANKAKESLDYEVGKLHQYFCEK